MSKRTRGPVSKSRAAVVVTWLVLGGAACDSNGLPGSGGSGGEVGGDSAVSVGGANNNVGAGDAGGAVATGGAGGTSSDTGGTAGDGGAAGGSSSSCSPGASLDCYSGPPGTLGVGSCAAGVQTCNELGTGYSACVGEVLPTFDGCATPADDDCNGSAAPPCSGGGLWSKRFGASGDERGAALAVNSLGDVIVGGSYFGSSPNFGGGALPEGASYGAFLAKYDGLGAHQWSKGFPNDVSLAALSIDDADGVVVTGSYTGMHQFTDVDFGGGKLIGGGGEDVFVARFDASGDHVWSKGFPSLGLQYASAVAVDASGNILLTGYFYQSLDLGGGELVSAGETDLFIAKFAADGTHLWSKRYGGLNNEYATGIAADAHGNVIVVGYFAGMLDFGWGPMSSHAPDASFVVKLDPDGNPLWNRSPTGTDLDRVHAVAVDAEDNIIMTGAFSGAIDWGGGALASSGYFDAFLAKLDPAGGHVFSRRFGEGSGIHSGNSVVVDRTGDIVLGGGFQGAIDLGAGALTSAGAYDVFLAKFLPSGETLWSLRVGDVAEQQAAAVAVDSSTNTFVTGAFQGFVNFGAPLQSTGGYDVFLAKVMP
ncbi:MAG: hypothetical protein U0271_47090 [Polyangiaceae bacterium]